MPVDVAAEVIANRPLSRDYNVLTLAAPSIASMAQPGQFVMIKVGRGHDPLLRRPFSVFEVLRGANGTPAAITILNKRIGASTRLVYDAAPGTRVACLGPLGRPFSLVDPRPAVQPEPPSEPPSEPGAEAWMVAGGVGLAPFAALAEALRARGVPCSLFYGARSGEELFYLDFFRTLGVDLVLTTEDGSVGERGRVVAPLERRLASRPTHQAVMVYACGPEGMMAATARAAQRHGCPCEVSVERIMGCGLGGCYSCVVPMREKGRDGEGHDGKDGFQHVRSCIAGPVLNGADILWD